MQSLRSNAALLVAPVSLTSKFVQHPRTACKACRRSLGKSSYSANVSLQQATALCTAWMIVRGPIHCQRITRLNSLPAYNSVDVLESHPLVVTTFWTIWALAISQLPTVSLLAMPLTGFEHASPLRASRAFDTHLLVLMIFAQTMHIAWLGDTSSAAITAIADKLYWCFCTGARMTKGLHICRHLHKAGWRVVLVDYDRWWMQGSRLSACCAAFFTVPDPEQDPVGEVARPRSCRLTHKS